MKTNGKKFFSCIISFFKVPQKSSSKVMLMYTLNALVKYVKVLIFFKVQLLFSCETNGISVSPQ